MKRIGPARERVLEIREKEVKGEGERGEEESLNLVSSWVPHKVKIFEFWE